MKKAFLTLAVLSFAALPVFAQSSDSTIGFQLGRSQPASDGVHLNFDDSVKEIFYSTDFDYGTTLKIKAGQTDASLDPRIGAPGVSSDGKIEYIDALVEYRFDEVFGSTSLFAGPGYYRQKFGSFSETDFGLSAGVNGNFPVTRKFGLIAEIAYHWANFADERRFVTASGGFQIHF